MDWMDRSEIEIEDLENGSGDFDHQSADEEDEALMEFKVDPDQILGGGYDYHSAEEEQGDDEPLMEFKVDPDPGTGRVLRERKIKKKSPPKSKNAKPTVKRDWTCPLTHCTGRLGGFKTRPCLRNHLRKIHNLSLSTVEGQSLTWCPFEDCTQLKEGTEVDKCFLWEHLIKVHSTDPDYLESVWTRHRSREPGTSKRSQYKWSVKKKKSQGNVGKKVRGTRAKSKVKVEVVCSKEDVETTEKKARRLQMELLKEMRKLNEKLGEFEEQVGKMEGIVVGGDVSCLEVQLEASSSRRGNKMVVGLRTGIVNASRELKEFREEICAKFVDCSSSSTSSERQVSLPSQNEEESIPDEDEEPLIQIIPMETLLENIIQNAPIDTSSWSPFKTQIYQETLQRLEKMKILPGLESLNLPDPRSDYCMKYHPSKDTFYVHQIPIILHEDQCTLECTSCGFTTKPLQNTNSTMTVFSLIMQQHVQQNHLTMEFSCPKCQLTFTQLGFYTRHIQEKHMIKLHCDLCSMELHSEQALIRHRANLHQIHPEGTPDITFQDVLEMIKL